MYGKHGWPCGDTPAGRKARRKLPDSFRWQNVVCTSHGRPSHKTELSFFEQVFHNEQQENRARAIAPPSRVNSSGGSIEGLAIPLADKEGARRTAALKQIALQPATLGQKMHFASHLIEIPGADAPAVEEIARCVERSHAPPPGTHRSQRPWSRG